MGESSEEPKHEIINKLLCNACLCIGRDLILIKEQQQRQYYLDILKDIPLPREFTAGLSVCWECKALLQKCLAFQESVKDSYRILHTYTSENIQERLFSDISRPPRLSVEKTVSINISSEDSKQNEDEKLNGVFLEYKDEIKLDCNVRENGDISDSNASLDSESDVEALIKSLKKEKRRIQTDKHKAKGDKKDLREYVFSDVSHPRFDIRDSEQVTEEIKLNGERIFVKDELDLNENSGREGVISDIPSNESGSDVDALIKFVEKEKKRIAKKKHKSTKGDKKRSKSSKLTTDKIITLDLSYEGIMQEREKEAARDSYVNSEYKCESCIIGFSYVKTYKQHMTKKHSPDLGKYICTVCKTIMSSVSAFTAHYKRHMRRYECNICHKRTNDMKVIQQHYYGSHHISLNKYTCGQCGNVSNSIDSHRYHLDTHKARVSCNDCDKTFSHRAGLMNHRLAVHELHNTFPCNMCKKVFRWKSSLKRHIQTHKESKSTLPIQAEAYCSPCGITFASVCSYQRHLKNSLKHVTHDQLKFICDHCNRRFADKTKIRDHIEEKHLFKTYQCHICLKWSKNRVGLDQHIRNVHKGRPHNKMCHHCGKGFPTKVQLESHIRTHTGERPFICEFCPTTFSQQSNLYKHNRQVHLNIKSKRYPLIKKRKDDGNQIEVPVINPQAIGETYRQTEIHYQNNGYI